MIKNYNKYLKEGNVGMGSLYYTEYPYQYQTMDNPQDRGKEGNVEFHQKNNLFQSIQNEMKPLIRNRLEQNNSNVSDEDVEKVLHSFFSLGNQKNSEIKSISDNCKDPKSCAKEIFDKYLQYVKINFHNHDNVNDAENILESFDNFSKTKLNGKYGFFMFLEIIDEMKNSFISEDYLNTSDFIIFFTTDKISDTNKLSDKLEYKQSLDVSYETIKHIGNLRLSFYFGIRDFNLEYGFHDDLKRAVYKTGQFKISSSFLKSLSSYKCISLIRNILKNLSLNDVKRLKSIKSDLKYLFDGKGIVEILDEERVACTVNKDFIKASNVNDYFDAWCFKHKWYYTTYNYTYEKEKDIDFLVKLKEPDSGLNYLKKHYDIKNIKKIYEDNEMPSTPSNPEMIGTGISEPTITEPLKADKLTARKYKPDHPELNRPGQKKTNPYLNKGDRAKQIQKEKSDRNKYLIKYYKELQRAVLKIDKDSAKNKSYLTRYIYKIVYDYKKPFSEVKKDILWMYNKLKSNPDFVSQEELRLKGIK
jgi:hypothetical protein